MSDERQLSIGAGHGKQWSPSSDLGLLEQRVAFNESRVNEFKSDMKELNENINKLHLSIASFGKIHYGELAAVGVFILGVTGALWGIAIKPINDDVSRLYGASIRLEEAIKFLDANKESKTDISELKADMKSRIEDLNSRLKRQ